MSGSGSRKSRRRQKGMSEVAENEETDHEEMEEGGRETDTGHAKLMLEGLANLTTELKSFKTTMRDDLTQFKTELKQEITSLRQDMEQKLKESRKEKEEQRADLNEAQARITQLEEWQTAANGSLQDMLSQTRNMQDKITELEARSRRNDIRMFGLPEDTEKDSVVTYLNQLYKRELDLNEDMELHIQRAHRTPPFKPKQDERPRAIVINFLKFETKEMILKRAWQKKIRVNDRPIQFDHDYPAEIVQKRRAYLGIKKILKEQGVRFQTPYTRMRVFWKDGIKNYNSATDAARDLSARGYDVNQPEGSGRESECALTTNAWQRVERRGYSSEAAVRVREKLREYQRP